MQFFWLNASSLTCSKNAGKSAHGIPFETENANITPCDFFTEFNISVTAFIRFPL
jgi:hypothetical protein